MKIRMRIITTTVLLCISFLLTGQQTSYQPIKSNSQQESITKVNRPSEISTPNDKNNDEDKKISLNREREWKKIKRQIKRNKKRASHNKNSVYTSRIIDTIYIDIPSNNRKTRLSGL
ncbi:MULTISPECIES: hypothetical protein [Aquimarina]|uniref:hypothetical protein n=1 Tax=Aquimarina TaxID=290174 RepID=UPI000D695AB9|nr:MULTISPECIES: hypothetical protein [Aquimarina]